MAYLGSFSEICLQNLADHGIGLSRSLKVNSDSAIELAINSFILIVNSNIGPVFLYEI